MLTVALLAPTIGASCGYIYALSLVYQREKGFGVYSFYGILRIALTMIGSGYYLLHSPQIHFILFIVSFIVALWLTILRFTLLHHER